MDENTVALFSRPLLSRVEHNEQVRQLGILQRMQYVLLSALDLSVAFLTLTLLALLAATVVYSLYLGEILSFGDTVIFALPIIGAFMVSIGFSGSPVPETTAPGETLGDAVRRAARGGFVYGLVFSLLSSLVWFAVVNLEQLYIHVVTIYSGYVSVERIAVQTLIIMLVTSPALAIFRAFICMNGYFILYRLRAQSTRDEPSAV